jgi:multiple sugar transport system ATP-binding protein
MTMTDEPTGLRICGLTRRVGAHTILDDVTLELEAGEMLILVGPSGCGKSSLLGVVAGLQPLDAGEIHLDGRRIERLSPRERDIAMVFQNYALYPHMSVAENIGFGLEMQGWPRARRDARVREVARMLQLEPLLARRPAQLSGGQRQRVAMGRALARQPRLFLFDEPLSNLDAQLRAEMRSEIKLLHQRLGRSAVYVTHDQTEAMTLGQRIAVLKAGRVQQLGTPQQVYLKPANLFVAQFLSSPAMNLLPARLEPEGELTLQPRGAPPMGWRVPPALLPPRPRLLGRPLLLGWRAESLRVGPADATCLQLRAPVLLVEPTGVDSLVQLQLGEHRLHWRCAGWPDLRPGDEVDLCMPAEGLLVFDEDSGERL